MWEGKRETDLRRELGNPEVAECGQLPASHGLQVNCLNSDTPMNPQTRTRTLRIKIMEMQRRKTLFDLETQATNRVQRSQTQAHSQLDSDRQKSH